MPFGYGSTLENLCGFSGCQNQVEEATRFYNSVQIQLERKGMATERKVFRMCWRVLNLTDCFMEKWCLCANSDQYMDLVERQMEISEEFDCEGTIGRKIQEPECYQEFTTSHLLTSTLDTSTVALATAGTHQDETTFTFVKLFNFYFEETSLLKIFIVVLSVFVLILGIALSIVSFMITPKKSSSQLTQTEVCATDQIWMKVGNVEGVGESYTSL